MSGQILQVLLIEDDAGDVLLVQRILQNCRQTFAVQQCELLDKALTILANGNIDVALLDLSLPDSFGLTGLSRVRTAAPDVPIVVLTGQADDDLALQALEQGAQDFLIKGNATADLLERTLLYAVQRQQIQTENRRLLTTMEALARQDPLTRVLNRHSFAESLSSEWQRARRYQRPLACVVLDIDFFKRVNDTYGHATGDRTLQAVANKLCLITRDSDSVGRLGGEEFCVLLPETTEEAAVSWAERARQEISELVIPSDHDELRVTVSLGVACHSPDLVTPQNLVDHADEAMFVAKQLGRDQVISFSRLRGLGKNQPSQIWEGISLKEIVAPLSKSLAPWQSITDAIELLGDSQMDAVAVLSDDGELIGEIGQDDILAATLTSSSLDGTVGDLMQTQLVKFQPDTAAREICEFLCRAEVRVFVVDDSGPIGVVRRRDFVQWLGNSIHSAAEQAAFV